MNHQLSANLNPAYSGLRQEIALLVPDHCVTVLDVGASEGSLGAHLLTVDPRRQVVGIEIDCSANSIAATRLTRAYNLDVSQINWAEFEPSTEFDCVILADVLEHLADPWVVMEGISRRLPLGACVIVSLPNVRHITVLGQIFFRGSFPQRSRGIFDRSHLRWFTPQDGVVLCEQAGFEVESVQYQFRLRDRSGGISNRVISRASWLPRIPGLRELLAYQVVISATKRRILD